MRYLLIVLAFAFSVPAFAQITTIFPPQHNEEFKNTVIRCDGTHINPDILFVIDGIKASKERVGKLDHCQVEQIQLLKRDEAAALYGKEGVNGVVFISTKCRLEFIFQDTEGKQLVGGATVKLFASDLQDTLMYVADSSGFLKINELKRGLNYGVLVSAVGYEDLTMPYTPRGGLDERCAMMKRKYMNGPDVVVRSIGYYKCVMRSRCNGKWAPATISQAVSVTERTIHANCYPNPLPRGGTLHVEIRSMQAGSLTLRILNAGGALVSSQQVSCIEGTNRIEIPADSRMVPGVYFVIVYDAKQQPEFNQEVIIQ